MPILNLDEKTENEQVTNHYIEEVPLTSEDSIEEISDSIETTNSEIEIKDTDQLQGMFNNDDFRKMWIHLHTPYKNDHRKVGRNEICPFCDSGKKFKNCECYKTKQHDLIYDFKRTKKW